MMSCQSDSWLKWLVDPTENFPFRFPHTISIRYCPVRVNDRRIEM